MLKSQLLKRATWWGIGYIFLAVFVFVSATYDVETDLLNHLLNLREATDNFNDSTMPSMLAYMIGLDIAFAFFFRKGLYPAGEFRFQLKKSALSSAFILLSVTLIPLIFYILTAVFWGWLGMLFLVLNLFPFIWLLVASLGFLGSFIPSDCDPCPKCGMIVSAYSKKYTGSTSYTSTSTTTTTEKIVDIYGKDTHLEVYGDVERTEEDTSTTYHYYFEHQCPNCGYGWGRKYDTDEYQGTSS